MVGMLQAIPGTKLHLRLKAQGRLLGKTSGNNLDGTTNFVPRMNREKLRDGYQKLMSHLYAPGPYYQRIRTFLREYKRPKVSNPVNLRYFLAFLRANVRLGVFSSRPRSILAFAGLDVLSSSAAVSAGGDAVGFRSALPQY